jgi:hypothetical protein
LLAIAVEDVDCGSYETIASVRGLESGGEWLPRKSITPIKVDEGTVHIAYTALTVHEGIHLAV